MSWPVEFGGQAKEGIFEYLVNEELASVGAPLIGKGVGCVGKTLIRHGSAKQKAEFLPQILNAEIEFCLGYSEPGAGSDLASLKLKAEKSDPGGVLGRLAKWLGGAALLTILGIGIWKYIDHSTEEKGRTTVATTVVENTNSTEVPSTPLNGTTERSEQELHGSNTTSIQQEVDRTAAISTGSQGPSGETPWKTEKPEVLANVASNNERTNKARQHNHRGRGEKRNMLRYCCA